MNATAKVMVPFGPAKVMMAVEAKLVQRHPASALAMDAFHDKRKGAGGQHELGDAPGCSRWERRYRW